MAKRSITVAIGLVIAILTAYRLGSEHSTATGIAAAEPAAAPNPPSEQELLQQFKDRGPDQAHAMMSVAYHFNNLWFAAEAENWPLADFYQKETVSHLRWAVRIIPKRKDSVGQIIDLTAILQAVENSPLKQLQEAVQAKDHDKFVAAYRFTLEGCYSCHKASDKPYLRPRIPDQTAEHTINFDPSVTWPK